MDQQLIQPTIKDLFVLLKRESLVNLKHKHQLKPVNNGQKKKIRGRKHPESTHHRKTSVVQKELSIVLEECNVSTQAKDHLCHEEVIPVNKNLLPKPVDSKDIELPLKAAKVKQPNIEHLCHGEVTPVNKNLPPKPGNAKGIEPPLKSAKVKEPDVEVNPAKNLVGEKVPVYRHVNENVSEKNNDLYEFDEIDDFEEGAKIDTKKKKRKNVKKRKPNGHVTKKSKTCKSYDVAMQEILEKVMKKINDKGKPGIKQKENVFDHGTTQPQDDAPHTNVADVVCSNQDEEVDKTVIEQNHENISSEKIDTENNNSIRVDSVLSPVKPRPTIHIISDVTLNDSDDYFFLDESLLPNANSTVLSSNRSNPWRFGVNFQRRPYYLDIKKTGLPSLQQDMVIDYILVKKIEVLFTKTPKKSKKVLKKASPTLKSKSSDAVDKENIPRFSLFESEEVMVDQVELLQINLTPTKNKRNVLGSKIQNEINIMKPVNLFKEKVVEIQTYFIRKSPRKLADRETEENLQIPRKEVRTYSTRKSPRKLPNEMKEDSPDESENENFGPKLFEDEEPDINFDEILIPKLQKKRKVRSDSIDSNHERHKRGMTKAEEAELDQWAASFNSLCDDIEKHELEIE